MSPDPLAVVVLFPILFRLQDSILCKKLEFLDDVGYGFLSVDFVVPSADVDGVVGPLLLAHD